MVAPIRAASPNSRANRRMVSSGTCVIREAFPGVYFFRCSFNITKASLHDFPETS